MDLSTLFFSLKNNIPFHQPDDKKLFSQHLHEKFDEFLNNLKQLDKNEFAKQFCELEKNITLRKFITIEKKICKDIEDIIYEVRNGCIHTAYKKTYLLLNNKRDCPKYCVNYNRVGI